MNPSSHHSTSQRPHRVGIALIVVMIIMAVYAATSSGTTANMIYLHAQSEAPGPDIAMADVADMHGPDAKSWRRLHVARFDDNLDQLTVSLDQIRRVLSEQGVNIATLSIRGYAKNLVRRVATPPPAVRSPRRALLLANTITPVTVHSPVTLRDQLHRWMNDYSQIPIDQLQVDITPVDGRVLDIDAGRDRIEFQAAGSAVLGKQLITIRRYRSGKIVDTMHIRPHISRRMLAVVAKTKLRPAQMFTRDNVEVREINLDRDRGVLITRLNDVLGKVAKSAIQPDTAVYEKQIRRPFLVRKGDLITVRCLSGSLVVRMAGRAEADGELGDTILVRNERVLRRTGRRQRDHDRTFPVQVTGQRQAVAVHTSPDSQPPLAAQSISQDLEG